MKATSQKTALQTKIFFLREKKAMDFLNLKEQYYYTIDSHKTINLIKRALEKYLVPSILKSDLMDFVIVFISNYLAKNIFDYASKKPLKKELINILKSIFFKQ